MKEGFEGPILFPGTTMESFPYIRVGSAQMFKNKVIKGSVLILALASLAGCAAQTPSDTNSMPTAAATPSTTPTVATSLTYSNTMYGFTFTLPLDWKGYTVVNDSWRGYDPNTNKTVQSGSLILIRNPKWTAAKKYQDIPIMVFTIGQWDSMIRQEFTVSAAPIPPSELARNAQFVFALPARYNYAFPEGYQEVEQILQGKPLHTS